MTRLKHDRRTALRLAGTALASALIAGCSGRDGAGSTANRPAERASETDRGAATPGRPNTGTTGAETDGTPTVATVAAPGLNRVGHALGPTPGEYAEGALRRDGRLGVLGSHDGAGSVLCDLTDPTTPRVLHHLPADDDVQNLDVKFDPRDGLYYRTEEPLGEANAGGVEVVDYGHRTGDPRNPRIVGRLEAGPTHNVFVHPAVPVVYAVNAFTDEGTKGLEIWDVEDPANPTKVREVWSKSGFHDVVFDPVRERLHCASREGYALFDASDPQEPTELGSFAYADRPEYTKIGRAGFEGGHYADFDPRRELAVVGDERMTGVPGGKHVFDIGWGDGSPEDPIPVGFTHSPNARPRSETDTTVWTTHNHDVVPYGERTLLVSGDYSEGVVLYDITDPTNPHAIGRHRTTAKAESVSGGERAPRAWNATYNRTRDIVFASDKITGAYVLDIG